MLSKIGSLRAGAGLLGGEAKIREGLYNFSTLIMSGLAVERIRSSWVNLSAHLTIGKYRRGTKVVEGILKSSSLGD